MKKYEWDGKCFTQRAIYKGCTYPSQQTINDLMLRAVRMNVDALKENGFGCEVGKRVIKTHKVEDIGS